MFGAGQPNGDHPGLLTRNQTFCNRPRIGIRLRPLRVRRGRPRPMRRSSNAVSRRRDAFGDHGWEAVVGAHRPRGLSPASLEEPSSAPSCGEVRAELGLRRSRRQRKAFDLSRVRSKTTGDVRLDDRKFGNFSFRIDFGTSRHSSQTWRRRSAFARNSKPSQLGLEPAAIWSMSVGVSGLRRVGWRGRDRTFSRR